MDVISLMNIGSGASAGLGVGKGLGQNNSDLSNLGLSSPDLTSLNLSNLDLSGVDLSSLDLGNLEQADFSQILGLLNALSGAGSKLESQGVDSPDQLLKELDCLLKFLKKGGQVSEAFSVQVMPMDNSLTQLQAAGETPIEITSVKQESSENSGQSVLKGANIFALKDVLSGIKQRLDLLSQGNESSALSIEDTNALEDKLQGLETVINKVDLFFEAEQADSAQIESLSSEVEEILSDVKDIIKRNFNASGKDSVRDVQLKGSDVRNRKNTTERPLLRDGLKLNSPFKIADTSASEVSDKMINLSDKENALAQLDSFSHIKTEDLISNAPIKQEKVDNPLEHTEGRLLHSFGIGSKSASEVSVLGKANEGVIAGKVIDQVADKIKQAISLNKIPSGLRLKLNPPQLGQLKIDITHNTKGEIEIKIFASEKSAEHILKEHIGELKDSIGHYSKVSEVSVHNVSSSHSAFSSDENYLGNENSNSRRHQGQQRRAQDNAQEQEEDFESLFSKLDITV